MGSVGGMLGLAGGQGGTGFSTQNGTNQQQIQGAYNGSQSAMGNQQGLLSALQGQNGLGNQSQVYNQLQGVVNGQGPNPAQAMLAQSTGQNVANQASLMAGQRGAGANVGLMARQAGQQGGALQQQAAGQGASMQAQQALGALGQAGGMADTMASNQIGQTNANVAAQQNEQSILQGANNANNNIQGQLANTTLGGQQKMIGGVMNAAGGAAGLAAGGTVPMYAGGGSAFGPQSMFAQNMAGQGQSSMPTFATPDTTAYKMGGSKKTKDPMADQNANIQNDANNVFAGSTTMAPMASGGKVPIMVSPGEKILEPHEAKAVASGKANPMSMGKMVPGKAKVKGDSYENDNVKTSATPGAVVIKRSIMSKQDAKDAADFVRAVMSKKGKK